MHSQQHPDSELLDRLRAGLLDDQPGQKADLEQHLAKCDSCRAHTRIWQQLDPDALGPQLGDNLADNLQAARKRALASATQRRQWNLAPYATAALLLLAVTVGLWTTQPGIDTTSQMTAQTTRSVPDIHEDLDFYLWLANQNGSDTGDGNPNST